MDDVAPQRKRSRTLILAASVLLLVGTILVALRRTLGSSDPMFQIAGEGCRMNDGGHVARPNMDRWGFGGAVLLDMEISNCPESYEATLKRLRPRLKGWTEVTRSKHPARPFTVFVRGKLPSGTSMTSAMSHPDSITVDVWPPDSTGTRVTATQEMRRVSAPASLLWLWVVRPTFLEPKPKEPELP